MNEIFIPPHSEEATSVRVFPINGARYCVTVAGSGPPLLLLHGFSGSMESWEPHRAALGAHFRTISIDLLGHGGSDAPRDPARYSMEHTVADLLALCDLLLSPLPDGGRERCGLLGYSMGGRVALHLALAAPQLVGALVLESASPGIADAEARARRVKNDEELAEFIERKGVAAFSRRWEALPLFASQRRLPLPVRVHLREIRMRNNPRGLANSLRGMGTGTQQPLHDRLGELTMPVLLIVGALDERYRAVAEEMKTRMPHARVEVAADAGHAVHLEQPAAFDRMVLAFFRALGSGETEQQASEKES